MCCRRTLLGTRCGAPTTIRMCLRCVNMVQCCMRSSKPRAEGMQACSEIQYTGAGAALLLYALPLRFRHTSATWCKRVQRVLH